MNALDLFAGPGGWDVGARELGIDPLGLEWDEAACETRRAAGLRTLKGDVAVLDPLKVWDEAKGDLDLLIASPPCQAWSLAGSRKGVDDLERVFALTDAVANGLPFSLSEWEDERSKLIVEPLRWALTLRPRLIALEQVPPVVDYWHVVAHALHAVGYRTWVGILSAERYGVPQTRKRAILLASLDSPPHPPMPTHLPYVAGEAKPTEPVMTLEGELLPWVSMAEALGWSKVKVGFPRRNDLDTDDEFRERDFRDADEPAFALTEKARSSVKLRAGTNKRDAERAEDEPAPTMRFGERLNTVAWVEEQPAPTIVGTRRSDEGIVVGRQLPEGEGRNVGGHGYLDTRQSHAKARPTTDPAPAMVGQNLAKGAAVFTDDPALETTEGTGYKPTKGVRVSTEEASVLQSFPPDYPWQGSRSKQFQQIGNAVPPLMAKAILEALTS